MQNLEIKILEGLAEVAAEAAQRFVSLSKEAIAKNGSFTVALAGGDTPQSLYARLADEPYRSQLNWDKLHVFFGDERCVPPDDPDSNYGAANDSLLSHVPIPFFQIYRMRGEDEPAAAAANYEMRMRTVFSLEKIGEFPRFDLILLGMGEDGHTASLFPNTTALNEQKKLVTANHVDKLKTDRLTFSLPTLNNAANVMFMIVGDPKAEALKQVLEGAKQPQIYPAQLVKPANGNLIFLVDKAAATKLTKAH